MQISETVNVGSQVFRLRKTVGEITAKESVLEKDVHGNAQDIRTTTRRIDRFQLTGTDGKTIAFALHNAEVGLMTGNQAAIVRADFQGKDGQWLCYQEQEVVATRNITTSQSHVLDEHIAFHVGADKSAKQMGCLAFVLGGIILWLALGEVGRGFATSEAVWSVIGGMLFLWSLKRIFSGSRKKMATMRGAVQTLLAKEI